MKGINLGVAARILDSIIVTLPSHDRLHYLRRGSQNFNSIIVLPSHKGERYYICMNTICTFRSSNHSLRVLLYAPKALIVFR